MEAESPAEQIDDIIAKTDGWRGQTLVQLRETILRASPDVTEDVKWKKPSRPEGVPVWCYNGNVCIADTLKNAVRLTFPKGAQMQDRDGLFNTRLDSKTVRAIDIHAGETIDALALIALILEAMELNR